MTATVDGLKELKASLKRLDKKVEDKLLRASMTASLRVIAKAIKSEVPSTWKEGRKAIGWSFKRGKAKSKYKGTTWAKAGVGAGIKKAKRQKAGKDRSGRKGVGQGVGNFHWFILGTADRETGSKRVGAHKAGVVNRRVATGKMIRRTGRIKPNGIVKRGTLKSQAAALAAMAKSLTAGIEREAAKAK
jgi:hypothetical protein